MKIELKPGAVAYLARLRADVLEREKFYQQTLQSMVLAVHGSPIDISKATINWDEGFIEVEEEE